MSGTAGWLVHRIGSCIIVPNLFSWGMEPADTRRVAEILINAPAWARVGLTSRDARLRERAADVLAATIVERIAPPPERDRNQLALPL